MNYAYTDDSYFVRNKRKYMHLDENDAFMEASKGLVMRNGLECKINCNTSKVFYFTH